MTLESYTINHHQACNCLLTVAAVLWFGHTSCFPIGPHPISKDFANGLREALLLFADGVALMFLELAPSPEKISAFYSVAHRPFVSCLRLLLAEFRGKNDKSIEKMLSNPLKMFCRQKLRIWRNLPREFQSKHVAVADNCEYQRPVDPIWTAIQTFCEYSLASVKRNWEIHKNQENTHTHTHKYNQPAMKFTSSRITRYAFFLLQWWHIILLSSREYTVINTYISVRNTPLDFVRIHLLLFAHSEQAIASHAKTKNCCCRENCFKQKIQRTHDRPSRKLRGGEIIVDIFAFHLNFKLQLTNLMFVWSSF